jgi:hypothetical protein
MENFVTVHTQGRMLDGGFYVALTRPVSVSQLSIDGLWPSPSVNADGLRFWETLYAAAGSMFSRKTASWRTVPMQRAFHHAPDDQTPKCDDANGEPRNDAAYRYLQTAIAGCSNSDTQKHFAQSPVAVQTAFDAAVVPMLRVFAEKFGSIKDTSDRNKRQRVPMFFRLVERWAKDAKKQKHP